MVLLLKELALVSGGRISAASVPWSLLWGWTEMLIPGTYSSTQPWPRHSRVAIRGLGICILGTQRGSWWGLGFLNHCIEKEENPQETSATETQTGRRGLCTWPTTPAQSGLPLSATMAGGQAPRLQRAGACCILQTFASLNLNVTSIKRGRKGANLVKAEHTQTHRTL